MEIRIRLPRPHPNQQKVLDSKAKKKVLLAGRRFGKSLIAQVISITRMLNKQKIAYVTPTFDLAKTFYNEVVKLLPTELITTNNKSELFIELITGGSLKFYSGESLSRFRGNKYHYIIIDEAAHIPNLKEEYGESILPTLIDYNGDLLLISTPRGKELFYSLFQQGLNKENGYESFQFTSYDNPHLSKESIDELIKNLTQHQFNQEILAIAGENSNNPIGTDNIKNNVAELSSLPPVVFGIDLAKYNDFTVITGLDSNGHMCYYNRFQKPWELTKDIIISLSKEFPLIPIYVDSTGVGDVVVEQLQLTCNNINGFKFTTESKPKIIYQLIKDIEAGLIKYNEQTANEMHTFEYKYSSTGHITFNAQSGYFDDSICSLAIANWYLNEAKQSAGWKLYFT